LIDKPDIAPPHNRAGPIGINDKTKVAAPSKEAPGIPAMKKPIVAA
jgi:hypothetical protein